MLPINRWVKATKSGGNNTGPNCVECLQYRAASSSDDDAGVRYAVMGAGLHDHCTDEKCLTEGIKVGDVVVRDSKGGPGSPVIAFTPMVWAAYVTAVADGWAHPDGDEFTIIDPRGTGTVLRFTQGEWDAFVDGCRRGEFRLASTSS